VQHSGWRLLLKVVLKQCSAGINFFESPGRPEFNDKLPSAKILRILVRP
jgi:hypothetical protein